MSAILCNFNRESICATCLSQNGNLIAVRDSQACISSYSELHLKLTDKICWLCHDFVQRMVAFKSRAEKAQAWLQSMANGQQNKLVYASPVTNVGMTETPYVIATDPLILPDIKPEPVTINQEFHELNHNKASSNHLQNISVPHILQHNHSAIIPGSFNSVMMKPEFEETTGNLHQNMACSYQQQNQNRVSGTPGTSYSAILMKSEKEDSEITSNLHQNMPCSYQLQQNHNRVPGTPGTSYSAILMKSENEDTEITSNLHQNMPCSYQLQQNQNTVTSTPGTSYSVLMKTESDEKDDNCKDVLLSPCKLQQSHCGDFEPVVATPLMKPKSESDANYNDNVEAYGNTQQHNTVCSSSQMENNLGAVTAKPLQIIKPVVVDNNCAIGVAEFARERNTNSVDTSVFTHKGRPAAAIKNKTADTALPDYIHTETTLTEDEMRQWRRIKPRTEFYARGVPAQRCEKCIEPFDYCKPMRAHAKIHTEAFGALECDICQQRTIDKKAMDMHRKWHYRLLKCRYCPFVWDDVNTMRRHCRETHSIPQVLWDCDRCERQLPSLQAWRKHERNHKVHKTTECPICGLALSASSVKTHVKRHHTEIPLKTCPDCGKQYRGEENLRSHMVYAHRIEADETTFCVKCNLQFRSQITYRAHLKSGKHIGKEQFRFECNDCGKKFARIGELRIHVDIHSDTKYPCEKCKKVFNTRSSRLKHTWQVHERRARREYICDNCGKVYTTKLHLLEHINTHTGARPYDCKLCGDTFAYKSALYLHGRFKHKIQKKNEDMKKIDHTKKTKGTKTKNKKVSES